MPTTTVPKKAKKAPSFRMHRRWCSTCARTRNRKVVAVDTNPEGVKNKIRIDAECQECKHTVVDFLSDSEIDSAKAHGLLS